jgi:3-oxoacyl-[acyl-carrier-protein] synthase II
MSSVVIKGMSVVSPIGTGVDEFFTGIRNTVSGTDIISSFDTTHFPVRLGAEARKNGEVIKSESGVDRRVIFNNLAFNELLRENPLIRFSPEKRMMISGSGLDYFDIERYAQSSEAADHRWQGFSSNACALFDRYAKQHAIAGGAIVNVSACVASSQAIGLGFRVIKKFPDRTVIAGGVDSMINPLHYMGFYKLGALSDWKGNPRESCRPFDRDRCGVVLGEGAAYFILESNDHSADSDYLAEITGYATTIDSYLVTDPDPDGRYLAKAALQAIEESGITPEQIDCVHAHGTGTAKNDVAESNAMRIIFGKRFRDVPVFSLKAQVGHLIGACGAVELAAAIFSLTEQVVPATANYQNPDPEIDLCIFSKPEKTPVQYLLKLNAAFGGQNTALVLKRRN